MGLARDLLNVQHARRGFAVILYLINYVMYSVRKHYVSKDRRE